MVLAAKRLAFVDTETTGLDPARDRVIEIGVVTVDSGRAEEWTTLINPRTTRARASRLLHELDPERARSLPRFGEVADSLRQRLEGALFIAHNARFDYTFLRAEFERAGIHFEADVLCSVMLSRKLYGRDARHDLGSLVERHGLDSDVRHRALPDARALYALWRTFERDHGRERLENAIGDLRAAPVLPARLDTALIDRLPEKPGVYVLHGDGKALHVGWAANLRLQLTNRFRLDRISGKALALAGAIEDITWSEARGNMGAQLQRAVLAKSVLPSSARARVGDTLSWTVRCQGNPALALVSLDREASPVEPVFGAFPTARKARNALARLADRHGLCRTLLGIPAADSEPCTACLPKAVTDGNRTRDRLKHLTRAYVALLPWKIEPWPYRGPVAVRERDDLHVLENWRYLGTGRDMTDAASMLSGRRPPFDREIYSILVAKLPRIARRRLLPLSRPVAPELEPA